MRSERHSDSRWALVFDKDDDVLAELTRFARESGTRAAGVYGIGAFRRSVVGFFDRDRREYLPIPVEEQVEVLSFVGTLGVTDEGPRVHVHVTLGRRDGSAVGGHLLEAVVWPTLELFVIDAPGRELRGVVDEETGLPLLAP